MWLVLKVGELVEGEGQRPLILVDCNQVTIVLRSAKTIGLCRNDFLAAAKIDTLWKAGSGLEK
jgi:pterin-4a-carbinolamine dehydratase